MYDQAHGSLPPVCTVDASGKPLHSWRTQITPDLERNDIYTACDFTKPWDSATNKPLLSKQLMIYACPSDRSSYSPGAAQTCYLAVVGPNTAWRGDKPCSIASLGKDAAHTVLIVESANSGIAWAEPKDFSLDMLSNTGRKPSALCGLGSHNPLQSFFFKYDLVSGVGVALADGRVQWLRTDNLSPQELRKILEVGGFTDEVLNSQSDPYAGRRLNWPNLAALALWLVSVGTLLTAAVRGRKTRLTAPVTDSAGVPDCPRVAATEPDR
jgi:hypothetical protein